MPDAGDPTLPAPSPGSPWRTLGWAAYLGISWTWCIGMFLPVLLMRDFGVWAFAVFAIPNVIGAAAMGWVLRSRDDVAKIWRDYQPAVRAFTLVTVGFHCFFMGWIAWVIAPSDGGPQEARFLYPFALTAAVVVVGLMVISRRELLASVLVWAVSLGLGALMLKGGLWSEHGRNVGLLRTDGSASLAFLAPVCIFGFLLCPYLDATFLRARANLVGKDSRVAFGVGFGVFFFSMILLTLAYSAAVEPGIRAGGIAASIAVALFPHFLLQAVFTILVHFRAMPGGMPKKFLSRAGLAIGMLGLFAIGISVESRTYGGLALGEVIYRCFMSFYGLAFPAYAWICMIPTRDGHSGTSGEQGRRKLATFAAAVVMAAPFFWMGFIERETWFLAPGLAIVLAARLMVRGRRGPP